MLQSARHQTDEETTRGITQPARIERAERISGKRGGAIARAKRRNEGRRKEQIARGKRKEQMLLPREVGRDGAGEGPTPHNKRNAGRGAAPTLLTKLDGLRPGIPKIGRPGLGKQPDVENVCQAQPHNNKRAML